MAINVIDTLEPGGEGFKVVDALNVSYDVDSNVDKELRDLNLKIEDFNKIFNGIPSFRITGLPEDETESLTIDLNQSFVVSAYVDSANAAECRILIRRKKVGTSTYQTFNDVCYPGQEYPILLNGISEMGTYEYSISITNGTKRCGLEGTISDNPNEIQYEKVFYVVCGTASLTYPTFTRINKTKIYSFDVDNALNFDFKYLVAETIDSYNIVLTLNKIKDGKEELIKKSEPYSVNNITSGPGSLLSYDCQFDFNIPKSGTIDLSEKYQLTIQVEAKYEGKIVPSSRITQYVSLDLMVDNSIIQVVSGLLNFYTSNDYLTFDFMPKTNNSNYLNSKLNYICQLYRVNGGENTLLKEMEVKAQNLQNFNITMGKFSSLDSRLATLEDGQSVQYLLQLQCTENDISSKTLSEFLIPVEKVEDNSGNFVTDGLALNFDFSRIDYDDNADKIEDTIRYDVNRQVTLRLLNAKIHNLKSTGIIDSSDAVAANKVEQTEYFEFKQGQGAVLYDEKEGIPLNPSKAFYYNTTDGVTNPTTGYSFEIFYKSIYLGDTTTTSASMSCDAQQEDLYNSGLTLPPGKAKIYLGNQESKVSLKEGSWRHVVIVVSTTNGKTQAKTYINGILSHIEQVESFNESDKLTPLAINGIYKDTKLTNSGYTAVKFIRHYCKPLSDDEVYRNFLTVYTEKNYKDVIMERNQTSSAINVFFIKNPEPIINKDAADGYKYIDFDNLNKITKKKPDSDSDTDNTSKYCAVNCTMIYSYLNEEKQLVITPYKNVDVYLQGTSSLKYPVKNYQIKVYSDTKAGDKRNILPPKVTEEEWPTADYVYTLKCDYMEESHRNNTPTACYYQDQVLDTVIDYCSNIQYLSELRNRNIYGDPLYSVDGEEIYSPYSPARRIIKEGGTIPYRDAINGRPCIVYYTDNNEININSITNSTAITNLANISTCAGSYMFNVDKEGAQLGFELDGNDVPGYFTDKKIKVNSQGKIDPAGNLNLSSLPCISYEGATNDNISAAAFVPYGIQRYLYLKAIWDSKAQNANQEKIFYLRKVTQKEGKYIYEIDTEGNGLPKVDSTYSIVFKEFGTSQELTSSSPVSLNFEDTISDSFHIRKCQSSFLAYINNNYHDLLNDNNIDTGFNRAIHDCYTLSEHKKIFGKDEYDYIKKTLEPRHCFAEDLSLPTGYSEKALTYSVMKEIIDWTYSRFTEVENPETREAGKQNFRNNFNKYFSFEYCLTYFLQMMLFTQVDNAGKNAMFDTWGNGKLYPRPYDMDTQMGLNNSGTDRIPVSAELNSFFSPQYANGTIENSTQGKTFAEDADRFLSYNTSNSALWKTFAIAFDTEIKQCYKKLRDLGVYDADNIQTYINSKTRDIIGETYYNKDANNKYLSLPNDEYFYCVNGSREDRYLEFLKERIVFLDTYFRYIPNGMTTDNILLRSQHINIGDKIVLRPLSPMYVTVTAEPNTTTCLITPEDTYIDELGKTQLGNQFVFKGNDANDKNMYISAGYNLSHIEGLSDLSLTEIQLSNVKNLTELDISTATAITNLSLSGSDKLKSVNLAGCEGLKIELNLSECPNIESIDISNSGVNSIIFPQNCNLKYLNCNNNKSLKALKLKNMPNLTNENLILTNCDNLITLEIENCNNIVSTETNPFFGDKKLLDQGQAVKLSNLKNIAIKNNDNFIYLSLKQRNLDKLELSGSFTKIDLNGCSGEAFKTLDLTDCSSLKYLDLNYVKSLGSKTDTNTLRLSSDLNFDYLNLASSEFKTLYTNSVAGEEGTFNFSDISFNSTSALSINYNTFVQKIKNLTYTGKLYALFCELRALTQLENCTLTLSGDTSISSLFQDCANLQTFKDCDFILTGAETANNVFYGCKAIYGDTMKFFIKAMPSTINSITYFAYATFTNTPEEKCKLEADAENYAFPNGITTAQNAFQNSKIKEIHTNLFKGCTSLTNASYVFWECSQLTTLPTTIFSECIKIENLQCAFQGCKALTSQVLSANMFGANGGASVKNISHLFGNCEAMYGSVNINEFLNKLPNLEYAVGSFYKCNTTLNVTEEYLLNSPSIKGTAAMFAKSKLVSIPKYLYNQDKTAPSNFTMAQGMFSNIVPQGDNTVLTKDFFCKCSSLQYIGDSTTLPAYNKDKSETHPFYVHTSTVKSTAGIFANIPNLYVSTEIFKDLINIVNISKAFFVGYSVDLTNAEYFNRDTVKPNTIFYSSTGEELDNTPKFFYASTGDTITPIVEGIDVFQNITSTDLPLNSVSYLFAGNNNIVCLTNNFINCLKNVTTLSGMLCNCIKYRSREDTEIGEEFLAIIKNKSKLSNISSLFENCFQLRENLVDNLFGETGCQEATSINCSKAFRNSGIIGTVPSHLFEGVRNKITDVSYMFAKCYGLTSVEQGYASNYNIPYYYNSQDTELNYYYDRMGTNKPESYQIFINNIDNFTGPNNNWFGEGQVYDRYRSYLEEKFYQTDKYPANLSKNTIDSIVRINDINSLPDNANGYFYTINDKTLYLYENGQCKEEKQGDGWYLNQGSAEPYRFVPQTNFITNDINLLDFLSSGNRNIVLNQTTNINLKSKYNFYLENNVYSVERKGLLSDCIKLNNVNYMFAGCFNLTGAIPADIFQISNIGNIYNSLTSLEGMFLNCTNLTLAATPVYTNDVTGEPTPLFIDANAQTYQSTLYDTLEETRITLSTGGNYLYCYPIAYYEQEDSTWVLKIIQDTGSKDDVNTIDQGKYFIPSDWAKYLTKVININSLFWGVGIAARGYFNSYTGELTSISRVYLNSTQTGNIAGANSTIYLYSFLKLSNDTFSTLKSLQTAAHAFQNIYTLHGTELNQNFLYGARNSLKDISYIFGNTPLSNVNGTFDKCGVLQKVKYAFYRMYFEYVHQTANAAPVTAASLYENKTNIFNRVSSEGLVSGQGAYIKDSQAPQFWNIKTILESEKQFSLTNLYHNSRNSRTLWFDIDGDNIATWTLSSMSGI